MAMIDYGAIAWKDGKLIQTEMFEDMEKMVGWSDEGTGKLCGNYFTYIGDEQFTVGFYKHMMKVCNNFYPSESEDVYFSTNFVGWKRWSRIYSVGNEYIDIVVKPRKFHDYYICKMKYRGHKYKVAFGYGVDIGYYKKTHIIDYYGTPWFGIKTWFRDIKYKYTDWRYLHGR